MTEIELISYGYARVTASVWPGIAPEDYARRVEHEVAGCLEDLRRVLIDDLMRKYSEHVETSSNV